MDFRYAAFRFGMRKLRNQGNNTISLYLT